LLSLQQNFVLNYNTIILGFLDNIIFILDILKELLNLEIVIIITVGFIICLSRRAGKILDITKKIVTTIAAATLIIWLVVLKMIKMNLIPLIMHKKFYKHSESFSFAFILSFLDITIPDHASTLTQFSFSVFLLSLVALFCLINILAYLLTYIFIQKGDYENKYPKLKILIKVYKNTSIFYVIIEILICLISLSLLIFFSISYV
jgi:hypothetical protein